MRIRFRSPLAFLPLSRGGGGGGGPESGAQLPNGRDLSAQINGAHAIPSFSATLFLTNVGPPPYYVILRASSSPAMCPTPFHDRLLLPHPSLDPLIFYHLITSHLTLTVLTPSPPFPLPRQACQFLHALSIRLSNCSRWQREGSSTSKRAELTKVVPNPNEAVIEVVDGGWTSPPP
jgi:hypothetical protein